MSGTTEVGMDVEQKSSCDWRPLHYHGSPGDLMPRSRLQLEQQNVEKMEKYNCLPFPCSFPM